MAGLDNLLKQAAALETEANTLGQMVKEGASTNQLEDALVLLESHEKQFSEALQLSGIDAADHPDIKTPLQRVADVMDQLIEHFSKPAGPLH